MKLIIPSKSNIIVLINFLILSGLISLKAQPSGGPYGPVRLLYEIPETRGQIYYVSPEGTGTGNSVDSPSSIETVVEKVKTGDVVIMRGGVYRTGNLLLNQGITIQPYKDELPVFKGTMIADNWKNLGNGLWTTSWEHLFPSQPADWWQRDREGKKTPLYRFNNDMVFVNGKYLNMVGWEGDVDIDSYYIDYEKGLVYIGADPSDKLVEITAFDGAIIRTVKEVHGKKSDHRGYTIKGVTFTQYAYRALEIEGTEPEGISNESQHGKDVVGSVLENCTISYCSRVAGYLRGDSLVIRNCKVSDTSTEGIYVISSNDVLLEKNIFTRNNIENITGYYPAAVKIFNQCYRVTCRDNLVIDLPNSNGIWYDVGNVDGVFVNNWIQGVGRITDKINTNQLWPSDNGFFFEISKGVICAGNIFVDCDHGMMILNSSNAQIYQNTFVNSMACIGRNGRVAAGDHFGWHASTGPDVDKRDGHIFRNNLLTGSKNFGRPQLFVWQPADLCGKLTEPQLKIIDNNVYVRQIDKAQYPLILWSPAQNTVCQTELDSPEGLNKIHAGFSLHSKSYMNYSGPLFKSGELGNYNLLPEFPGGKSAFKLPVEILKHMGSKEIKNHVGALPIVK